MRLKNYNEALEIFKLVLKETKLVPALANIAILYDTMENYEKAIFITERPFRKTKGY